MKTKIEAIRELIEQGSKSTILKYDHLRAGKACALLGLSWDESREVARAIEINSLHDDFIRGFRGVKQ